MECQRCASKRILHICGKCSDLCCTSISGHEKDGYVPTDIGLLDEYERRLADRGYLTVRHSRWQAKGYSLQICSILWPTRGKWHRWLVLAAAGSGTKRVLVQP